MINPTKITNFHSIYSTLMLLQPYPTITQVCGPVCSDEQPVALCQNG